MATDLEVSKQTQPAHTTLLPPAISGFTHLQPRNLVGGGFVSACSAVTGFSIYFSTFDNLLVWALAQIVLAFSMLQWFVLLHEAGHRTLFKNARLNKYAGHLASLFAGIPFECWKSVHGIHHRWTGWQDLDVTTSALLPKQLKWWESLVVNACWKLWIPLFSVLYRTRNYWNLARLYQLFPRRQKQKKLTWNVGGLLAIYVAIVGWVGLAALIQVFGVALLLSLIMQDILILSQHAHIPMENSQGEQVDPFAPVDQEIFTRSLRFPNWFSTFVLLNMDAHELHHMYTRVPGYYLRRIDYDTHHEVGWWRWLRQAKQVPGEVLLFQNSHQSGFEI